MAAASGYVTDALCARYYLYTVFRSIFGCKPDSSWAAQLDSRMVSKACSLVGLDAQEGFTDALDRAREADADALADAYTKTLVGPGKLPANPWEAVYVTGEEALFQRETLDVRNAYRAQGLLPELYPRVSDDYLALECAFLAELGKRACAELENGDEPACAASLSASGAFLEEHLCRWVSRYADDLESADACELYTQAAKTLAEFARQDQALLREAIARIG